MALPERPGPHDRPTPPREPFYRKKELHLVIGVLVAALTVAFASQRATEGARAVLDNRLIYAGAGADAGIVDLESLQLSAVRSIAFTPGVATDLATLDGPALNKLVAPLAANSTVPMVDMVIPDGRVLFAARAKGAPLPTSSHRGLPALKWAYDHAHGPRGGRLSQIVIFKRGGATLVTISPVMLRGKPVGAAMAMTPLANVLGRLSQEVWADLTVYDSDGAPIATTAAFTPRPLPAASAKAVIAGGATETRYVYADHREKLGRLIVDHTAQAVLGVSLEDDSNVVGRTVAIYGVIGLICTVLILATFWARVVNSRRVE